MDERGQIQIVATTAVTVTAVLAFLSMMAGKNDWAGIFVILCILSILVMALPYL
jgi:hypothetical protein